MDALHSYNYLEHAMYKPLCHSNVLILTTFLLCNLFPFDNVNYISLQVYVFEYTWYGFIPYYIHILVYNWYDFIPFSIHIFVYTWHDYIPYFTC